MLHETKVIGFLNQMEIDGVKFNGKYHFVPLILSVGLYYV